MTLPPVQQRFDETAFQRWYKAWAAKAGLDPDPDNPLHRYDYRAAYRAGAIPKRAKEDGLYHWPSEFKAADHPNRFVNGMDTKYGRPAGLDQLFQNPDLLRLLTQLRGAFHPPQQGVPR